MQRYILNKKFSSRSPINLELVHAYIDEHPYGHRVFNDNFDGFDISKLLMMLGCNISYVRTDNGKYVQNIDNIHVYEDDTDGILTLIGSLE